LKILADAKRRAANARRTHSGATAAVQSQERAIAILRAQGQDTGDAEKLLAQLRVILDRSADDLVQAEAAHTELEATPSWRLTNG
jgi:hypothetical protein